MCGMNELQLFSDPKFGTVRTVLIDGEPWMVGVDVAKALGYDTPRKALSDHVDKEDKMGAQNGTPSVTDSLGRIQHPTWINESGLYSLILSCKFKDDKKIKEARRFKRWVTSEVLPTLRKTGRYTTEIAEPEQRAITTDDYLTAARILAGCRNERMPYVVKLLRQAGIDVELQPRDAKPNPQEPRQRDPQTAKLLTVAIEQYHISRNSIARHTGIWEAQLKRMQQGTAWYVPERAKAVRDAVHEMLPHLDIDAIYNSVT